jgi:signal transduction histidine kinase
VRDNRSPDESGGSPVSGSPEDIHRRALVKIDHFESLSAAIRAPRPLNKVIELVMGQISDVVPASAAAVWLYDADNDLWYIGGSRGLSRRASKISFKTAETLHAKIGEQGAVLEDLAEAGFRRLYPEHDTIRRALYAPMTIAGRRVGLIALYRASEEVFTDDDLAFVRAVGAHIGMAVSFAALEARAERTAVLEERARLGADLHDGILQILSSVRLYASELRSTLDGSWTALPDDSRPAVEELLALLEGCVDAGSEEIGAAINHLRTPQPLRDVKSHLDLAAERLRERGIESTVLCQVGDIDEEVADALAWITREAASNILQHSLARHVSIELLQVGSDVQITIADDGIGVSAPRGDGRRGSDQHLGRSIMRERTMHVGGHFRMSSDSRGTTVQARMPAVPLRSPARETPAS